MHQGKRVGLRNGFQQLPVLVQVTRRNEQARKQRDAEWQQIVRLADLCEMDIYYKVYQTRRLDWNCGFNGNFRDWYHHNG